MTSIAAIAAWLPRARWFGGKGADAVRVSIHDAATIADGTVTLTLLDVVSAGAAGRYVAPLAGDADAALAPDFAEWLVRTVLDGAMLAGRHGVFHGHPASPASAACAAAHSATTVAALGGDASNTSLLVVFGGRGFAVKLLRRCRTGIQPEVEVGEFLTRDVGWEGTPRFRGWLGYAPSVGDSIALATVHDFADGCSSAWDRLVPLVRDGGLSGPRRDDILHVVGVLGRTTAEMHRALASRSDVTAFAPRRSHPDDARGEALRMTAHAAGVFDLAAVRLPALPPGVAADVRLLLDRRAAIVNALGRLSAVGASASLIRVHGDYHLGQVLLRDPGPQALVIDFEGEPGRSLEDRRRRTSALKDVAGMCRSFDYLLRHAGKIAAAAYRPADLRLLERYFTDAYRGVAEGHAWWPDDPAAAAAILDVYTLDKAVYELAYELTNRPDWVEVPLAALLAREE